MGWEGEGQEEMGWEGKGQEEMGWDRMRWIGRRGGKKNRDGEE